MRGYWHDTRGFRWQRFWWTIGDVLDKPWVLPVLTFISDIGMLILGYYWLTLPQTPGTLFFAMYFIARGCQDHK